MQSKQRYPVIAVWLLTLLLPGLITPPEGQCALPGIPGNPDPADGAVDMTIQGCRINGNASGGIRLQEFQSVTINDNVIDSNGLSNPYGASAGVWLFDVASVTIKRNTITNSGRGGIVIDGDGVVQTITIGGPLAPDGSLGDGNVISGNKNSAIAFGRSGGGPPCNPEADSITGSFVIHGTS